MLHRFWRFTYLLVALVAPGAAWTQQQPKPESPAGLVGRYGVGTMMGPKASADERFASEQSAAVNFAFGSADVDLSDSRLAFEDMQKGILAPERQGHAFLIAGHGDARGSDAVNDALSQRRADAVRQILVEQFAVPA